MYQPCSYCVRSHLSCLQYLLSVSVGKQQTLFTPPSFPPLPLFPSLSALQSWWDGRSGGFAWGIYFGSRCRILQGGWSQLRGDPLTCPSISFFICLLCPSHPPLSHLLSIPFLPCMSLPPFYPLLHSIPFSASSILFSSLLPPSIISSSLFYLPLLFLTFSLSSLARYL